MFSPASHYHGNPASHTNSHFMLPTEFLPPLLPYMVGQFYSELSLSRTPLEKDLAVQLKES